MATITSNIKRLYPKAFRAARKSKFRVVWLEDDLVYVARRGKGHDRYLVRFVLQGDGGVGAYCRTATNGACDGCRWNDCCAHIAVAIERGQKRIAAHGSEKKAA